MGVAKVHKLLYYCQAWHVVLAGKPMFPDDLAAFVNGPVVVDLWHDENKGRSVPPSTPLDRERLATLEYVLDRYGRLTGAQLIELSHGEDPWRELSMSEELGAPPAPLITLDALRVFFERDDEYVGAQKRAAEFDVAEVLEPVPFTVEELRELLYGGDTTTTSV